MSNQVETFTIKDLNDIEQLVNAEIDCAEDDYPSDTSVWRDLRAHVKEVFEIARENEGDLCNLITERMP